MQPGKARRDCRGQIDHLRALDQAPRLQVDALLAVLQRQFDPVADQRLAGQQLIFGRAMGGAEGLDQPDARRRCARPAPGCAPSGRPRPVRPRPPGRRARAVLRPCARSPRNPAGRRPAHGPGRGSGCPASCRWMRCRSACAPVGQLVEHHLARLAPPGPAAPDRRTAPASGKISRRSSNCRSSSIEDSSTKPTSSGSSRRFQPLMKSLPRSPAAARAPGSRRPVW
jgi:hypothetical protein